MKIFLFSPKIAAEIYMKIIKLFFQYHFNWKLIYIILHLVFPFFQVTKNALRTAGGLCSTKVLWWLPQMPRGVRIFASIPNTGLTTMIQDSLINDLTSLSLNERKAIHLSPVPCVQNKYFIFYTCKAHVFK